MLGASTPTKLPMPAASAPALPWFEQRPLPYRACDLCTHRAHTMGGPAEGCAYVEPGHRTVRIVPLHLARARGGHCGPEAERLAFPGLTG